MHDLFIALIFLGLVAGPCLAGLTRELANAPEPHPAREASDLAVQARS